MLLGLVLLLVSLLCACHDGLPERTADTPPPTSTAPASSSTESSARSYVGSQACSACHPEVYSAWRGTSHSYSVLSAAEARRAGYPLPVGASAIRSWSDVSYVIGGRERITYADAAGMVQRESYHHRVTSWDRFPSLPMTTCGPCHFTAFGAGIEHPDDPVLPGKWAERNIGCESCHGPGSQHVASLDPTDIETDYSSRSCGSCHTTVGRVLPEDEWHSTHDLVQTWNRDPHVTGGQFHSQSRFCSRCHAPRDASVLDAQGDAAMPVFSENKDNITCVGCHNPHAVTNPSYAPDTASLAPPLGSSLHAYVGDDGDFTTTDFATFSDREQLCTHCHSGADRIELDHANATCSDCHNTFHSNRDVQSRIDHDANRPRLSCRQCHRDSEYLMSIVFEDPVFLEPKNIHDLTSLPAAAIERYGLRYVRLARAASRPAGLDGEQPNVETPEAPETIEPVLATVRRMEPGPDGALHELVARGG